MDNSIRAGCLIINARIECRPHLWYRAHLRQLQMSISLLLQPTVGGLSGMQSGETEPQKKKRKRSVRPVSALARRSRFTPLLPYLSTRFIHDYCATSRFAFRGSVPIIPTTGYRPITGVAMKDLIAHDLSQSGGSLSTPREGKGNVLQSSTRDTSKIRTTVGAERFFRLIVVS